MRQRSYLQCYHCSGPDVNGQILPYLFQEKRKQQIWHKYTFRGGEFKLTGSHSKNDVRTIPFLVGFSFSVHMFAYSPAYKDENVKFFRPQVQNLSYTTR